MSLVASRWAWTVKGLRSLHKLVLLALADRADQDGRAWPSYASLIEDTGIDRKTISRALAELRKRGLIQDTGERKGDTKQVPVIKLTGLNTIKSQKRNRSQKGTVPFFHVKSSQNGTPNSSQNGTGNLPEEPIKESKDINTSKKITKKISMILPEDFGISEDVREWAREKGYDRLDEHLERFIGYAKANGKTYVDWDEAFKNAIRDDWAKLRCNSIYVDNSAPGRVERAIRERNTKRFTDNSPAECVMRENEKLQQEREVKGRIIDGEIF